MDIALDVVRYEEVSDDFGAVMDRVVEDRAAVVISRPLAEPVVLVSMSEWRSIQETNFLLSSPKNAARLMEGVAQLNAGQGIERQLIDP